MSSTRSSRASTPASDEEVIVSPRSKIQAMLAEIDADSEDDDLHVSGKTLHPRTIPTPSISKTSVSSPYNSARPADHGRDIDASEGGEEEDDDDEPVVKPRGRLAARMTATAGPFHDDDSDSEQDKDGDVYQRIRKEMLAEKSQGTNSPVRRQSASPSASRPDTPPRRRLAPRARQLAKSPAASSTRSESPGLFMSPGPERARTRAVDDSGSESDLPDSDDLQARRRKLVEEQRKWRQQMAEAEEERYRKDPEAQMRLWAEDEKHEQERLRRERADIMKAGLGLDSDDELDLDAEEAKLASEEEDEKFTQRSRPARKASKKAREDMNRETQRMSRNMQLTHQAKTKKKYTTADFLSRFGAIPKVQSSLVNVENAADSSSVAAHESDVEKAAPEGTPPSSPPSTHDDGINSATHLAGAVSRPAFDDADTDDEELPEMGELRSSQNLSRINKSKAPIRPQTLAPVKPKEPKQKSVMRHFRIIPPPKPTQDNIALDDSDSDLEIIPENRVSAVFASVGHSATAESRPLHILRHLAHLNHSEKPRLKKGAKPSMTPNQLEAELRRRAKIQAIQEREEKLAILKAKGIVIMTEEEKEKDQVEIENMLERAREEAEKLRKKEKKADKDAGVKRDDALASSDESEDDDYVGTGEEDEGEGEVEEDIDMSGSEEEEEEELEEEGNGLIDNEANEDDDDQEEAEQETLNAEEVTEEAPSTADAPDATQMGSIPQAPLRRARVKRVVEDEDDEQDDVVASQGPPPTSTNFINDDLAAAFGFGPAPAMGVSQMFAGTMADTQDSMGGSAPDRGFADTEEDSLDMLRRLPSAPMPTFLPAADTQYSPDDSFVRDSQAREESQGINLHSSLLQETPSMRRTTSTSQFGDMDFTPSQDVGMRADATPLKINFAAPQSTQDTVLMDVPESPVVPQPQRKGRLFRRPAAVQADSDEELVTATPAAASNNAFEAMRKAASKAERRAQQADFNKKASEARRMVEEQAEESEDEYAGLGGASDDEALADLDIADEADKAMIDESEINVNERELAAFYAEKARNADEAQTSKLYRDLMSGAMRKRRGGAGGAFDLDSDEDEQMAERRRRRQREEARKRRLLLQDESVGKLGTNEKKEAFLRAIEDRDDDGDDDMGDFLDGHDVDDDSAPTDSQGIAPQDGGDSSQQPLQETSANAAKRKAPSSQQDISAPAKRAKQSMRRNPLEAFRAPRSLEEIRDSVSFLIEDAHIDPEANGTIFLSDDDDDDDEYSTTAATRAPARDRRTGPRNDVVDRLTLKKQSSSVLSAGNASAGAEAMAFAPKPALLSSASAFSKAPSLLRRATTNGSTSSLMPPPPRRENSGSVVGGSGSGNGVRMGGSKKSSINYQAREAERKSVLERAERKRKEGVARTAGLRRGVSDTGGSLKSVFGSGGFE